MFWDFLDHNLGFILFLLVLAFVAVLVYETVDTQNKEDHLAEQDYYYHLTHHEEAEEENT